MQNWRPTVRILKRKTKAFWVFRWKNRASRYQERLSDVPVNQPREKALRAAVLFELALTAGRVMLTWQEAADRYEDQRMSERASGTAENWRSTRRLVEQIAKPAMVEDFSTELVDVFRSGLRRRKQSAATIAGHLRYLRSFLRWCKTKGYIAEVPTIEMPSGSTRKRSRNITLEEFERIVAVVPIVRPRYQEGWIALLHGLWESGLRIEELISLHWTEGDVVIDLTQRLPGFRFNKQKNKKEGQWIPMTPQFFERFIQNARNRTGFVFPVWSLKGEQVNVKTATRVIGEFGVQAGVVTGKHSKPRTITRVNKGGKRVKLTTADKFATSHDIGRRAFSTRHAHLGQWQLAALMRHESPRTTQQFYVGDQALAVAAQLWASDKSVTKPEKQGEESDELPKNNAAASD